MTQAIALPTADRIGWLTMSWRLYLLCLGTSFFVLAEPAPTDAFFLLALGAFMLSRPRMISLIGPIATVAILLYLWFTLLSLSFDTILKPLVAVRATGVEFYLILLFLMTAYFTRTGGDRAFRVIMMAMVCAALITSVIGAMAYLNLMPDNISGLFFRDEYRARIRSTFKDPNVLGPFLVAPGLFSLWVAMTSKRWRHWGALAFFVIIFCLVVTYSRGAWIHMLISTIIFFVCLLIYRGTAKPAVFTILSGIIALLLVAIVLGDSIAAALSNSYLGNRLSLQSYDDDRFDHIGQGLTWIMERPFGVGPNQVNYHHGHFPHNTFTTLAINNGIVAALGFAVLYFAAAGRCLLMMRRQEEGWLKYAFVLAILAGLVLLMNVVVVLHWRHIYVVMGMAYGTYRRNALF